MEYSLSKVLFLTVGYATSIPEVEVVFPYEPQHDDELRLNVGDVITNVNTLETGWYRGSLGNVSGVFPDNFVKYRIGRLWFRR
ncbi:SH3-domain kinase binding protein 1 [Halocaridina rubra]|uniref:SH3-domain kinase binding protein 1 n=1 Tax=Halocaridina rubra TaxID=373956 RepID=A0AAN8X9L1_HALRR